MQKSVCVVGGGPSGLVATKTLKAAGHQVTCFEAGPQVGGHWVLNNPSGRSSAYDSLTTNTSKQMSRLSDYEMPEAWPEFPGHAQLAEWWRDYVATFKLEDSIRCCYEVLSAEPGDGGGWQVTTRHQGRSQQQRFDCLVAASGNYWDPKLPDFAGHFSGVLQHARRYRSPEQPVDVRGRRVLVIGTGNTGCELALEMQKAGAAEVHIAARSGTWIMPKYVDGPDGPVPVARQSPMSHPLDEVPGLLRRLPRALRERLFLALGKVMLRRSFGAYQNALVAAGLPPPPKQPLSKRPTVAHGLLEALEAGDIVAHGAVVAAQGSSMTFLGGEKLGVDVVYCATGYHLSYPYLAQDVLSTMDDDMRLFLGLMHPERHDLFVIGVSRPTGSFWPIAEVQAMFVAELLSGRYSLPAQRRIERLSGPTLARNAFNPALYGLSLREELARGAVAGHHPELRLARA